VISEPEQKCLW